MSSRFNRNVENIPASGIRRVFDTAARLKKAEKKVYPFHIGMPNFDTPDPIKNTTIHKLKEGFVHYTPNAGIPELIEAITKNINQNWDTSFGPSNAIVTVGACEAISIALLATLEPGDKIIVPTPCWLNYLHLPRMMGIKVHELPQSEESSFLPDPTEIEASITPDTKAILLNSPTNPTGAVISKELMEQILKISRREDIWLIFDEIYKDILYDTHQHTSVLPYMNSEDLIISISGFSKTYSMTGWRLGYVIASRKAIKAMLKVHQYLVTSACSFAQWGGVTATQLGPSQSGMLEEYQKRRDMVVKTLKNAEMSFVSPGGAFYVFPRIPRVFASDEDFCHKMLLNHGLGFVPGSVFGKDFGQYFRLSFACSTEEVIEGMNVFGNALRSYIN